MTVDDDKVWLAGCAVAGWFGKTVFNWIRKRSDVTQGDITTLKNDILILRGELNAFGMQVAAATRAISDVTELHAKVREIKTEMKLRFGDKSI